MYTPESLENGEFLILTDDSFHAVGQAGLQIQMTPSTLYLTNFNIYLEPQFDVEITRKIALSDITGFNETIVNDCPVLEITSEDVGQKIMIFIPDDTRSQAFPDILKNLQKMQQENQESCDKYALIIRRSVQEAASLDAFYKAINEHPPTDELLKQEQKVAQKIKAKKAEQNIQQSLIPFNFFADLVETSPEILFSAVVIIISFLSLIFQFISFGVFTCSAVFTFVVIFGLQKVIGKRAPIERIPPDDAEPSIRPLLASNNQFYDRIDNVFRWEDTRATLEVATFLLILILMFTLYDPAVLLFISLVGLAFFDRWDPFKLGSLSSLLSKLILW